jgi:hypothetical protein
MLLVRLSTFPRWPGREATSTVLSWRAGGGLLLRTGVEVIAFEAVRQRYRDGQMFLPTIPRPVHLDSRFVASRHIASADQRTPSGLGLIPRMALRYLMNKIGWQLPSVLDTWTVPLRSPS